MSRLVSQLKRKRLATGKSAAEVAKEIGCSPAALYGWENGTRTPESSYYPKLAKSLGVSAGDLVDMILPPVIAS